MGLKNSLILMSVFLFLVLFVSAAESSCDVAGEINSTSAMYCSNQGVWEDIKEDGAICVNNYECFIGSCIDGLCQSIYSPIEEHGNLLQVIWDKFGGIQCNPSDQSYHCEGDVAYLCGALGVYEEKGRLNGVCGYNPGGGGSPGGGGGSSCVANWICTPWSSKNSAGLDCGTRTCTLKNSCNKGKPLETLSCGITSSPTCGNDVCDAGERISCPSDCGIVSTCGDGTCDAGESTSSCPVDCKDPIEPKNYRWVLILIIVILLSAIIFVSLVIWNKLKEDEVTTPKKEIPKTNTNNPLNKSK